MNSWGLNAGGEWVWSWIPAALIGLYLFRPRHRTQSVPAAFLWKQVADKLGGQRLWRRLQQHRLLWLQLLFCLLAILALLRPYQVRPGMVSRQVILLVDTSASMDAGARGDERLARVLRAAREILNQAPRGTEFLLATADRELRLLQPFTTDRRHVEQQLASVVARGLRGRDELLPAFAVSILKSNPEAQVHWFSDHELAGVPTVPHLARQGEMNWGIESFQVVSEQVFLALKNYNSGAAQIAVRIEGPRGVLAERTCSLKGEGRSVLSVRIPNAAGVYHARILTSDDLGWDNQAWAQVQPTGPRKILAHGAVSPYLEAALQAATGAPVLRQTDAAASSGLHIWSRLPEDFGGGGTGSHFACAPPQSWIEGEMVQDEGAVLVAEAAQKLIPVRLRSTRWGSRYRLRGGVRGIEPLLVTAQGEPLVVRYGNAVVWLFSLESSELPMSPELPVLLSALLRADDDRSPGATLCGNRLRLPGPGPLVLRSGRHTDTLQGSGAELDWTPSWPGLYTGAGRTWAVNFHAPDESDLDREREQPASSVPAAEHSAGSPTTRPMAREFGTWLALLGLGVLLWEWKVWNGTRR